MLDPDDKVQCGDCRWVGKVKDLPRTLEDGILCEPDGDPPIGECPKCGHHVRYK